MISKLEQDAVQSFVTLIVREVWPTAGLSEEAMATAAWSLYATTMANLQMLVLNHGDAEMLAGHRKALLDHNEVIAQIAACRTEGEVVAVMGMASETVQERGRREWTPSTEVKG